MKSNTWKWVLFAVLVVVGILAAIVAVEYLTVSIAKLPSWLPGHHHAHGHYHKRGYAALVVAIVAFGFAAYLVVTIRRGSTSATAVTGAAAPPVAAQAPGESATDLLSGPATGPSDTPPATQ